MIKKLVSILTPCYNSGKFIHRLLDSVLIQTYPNIEMFVIDDGSKDNSAEVINSYIPKFKNKGYSLTYIYQENAGQSSAINRGLKLCNGEYLGWPDSDDYYAVDDAIEQMVYVLESSEASVSMVRCFSSLLDEKNLEVVGKLQTNINNKNKVDLFEDCLLVKNGYWFGAGNYMAKTAKLVESIPNKEIYTEKNAGQNWQLMLPLLYNNKCLTIEKSLYNVLVRRDSHSRGQYSTFDQVCAKFKSYENTLIHTIYNIINLPDSEKDKYLNKIQTKYQLLRFTTYLEYKKNKEARTIYCDIKCNGIPNEIKLQYFLSYIPLGNILFIKLINKVLYLLKHCF